MFRTSLAALALAAIVGCSASVEPISSSDQSASREAQLAAFAAAADNQFPADAQARDDLRVAAIVNQKNNMIRIYNFTDEPITNAKLWVNSGYVREIDRIPPNGWRTVSFGELFNSGGRVFTATRAPITNLQLQTGDDLNNLMGPIYE